MSLVGKPDYQENAGCLIPCEWVKSKLSELVDVIYGKSPAEIQRLTAGIPIFGTGGITGYTDVALYDGPSVILGRKGTIDKVQRSNSPFWAIDTTFYTIPKQNFDWAWLYYLISSFDLKKLNEASGVPSLGRSSLESLDLAVPPLPEQQKIATILSAVDAKLDVIGRQIEATQILKQGLMQALFSRGVGTLNVSGQWVPHSEFKTVLSFNIPTAWDVVRLGDIAPLIRRPVETHPDTTYPELGLRSYGKGTFHKPALLGSEIGNKRIFEIKAGDLLFSNVFAWEGAVAIAKPEDDGRYGSHRYITCAVDKSRADTSYICRYLITPVGISSLSLASPGGAGRNKTLGLSALADITIPLPPLAEQQKVSQILDGVDAKLQLLEAKQCTVKSVKRGLMQKLLTGEWRVKLDSPTGIA